MLKETIVPVCPNPGVGGGSGVNKDFDSTRTGIEFQFYYDLHL